jgi:hypothetical protein
MDKWLKRNTTNNSSRDVQPSTSKGIENKSNKRSSDVQPSSEDKKVKTSWTRKYFKFGFISAGSDNHLPLCVTCHATLSDECMKPLKLKCHLECKHPEYSSKPNRFFFVNKKNELSSTKKSMKSALSMSSYNENVVLASYEVSKLIADTGYPHTICEKLILPALKIPCLWKKEENQSNSLSLSNNTAKRRFEDMAKNTEETLIHRIQNK